MADVCIVLPPECWQLIFNRLDDLEAISLVCKNFFSISNSLQRSLELYKPTYEILCRLLKRFRHLKEIYLNKFQGDFGLALLEIARSGLNLEALCVWYPGLDRAKAAFQLEGLKELGWYMKKLKTLEYSHAYFLGDSHLAIIATSLPWLQELVISGMGFLTDDGIEFLASKLHDLRKINISFNEDLTDRSLLALSSNCVFLREIKAWDCGGITQNCIGYLFRHSPNLVSVSVNEIKMNSTMSSPSPSLFTIGNSITYAKALHTLKIPSTDISDSCLHIAEAQLPLKTLSLSHCQKLTVSGLSMLLQACQSLEELNLGRLDFLNDEYMSDLSKYLHNLTYINLSSCISLTNSTFFILIKNCPSLKKIEMKGTRMGAEEDLGVDLIKNHCIQTLDLAENRGLNDESLRNIGLTCPNLQYIDLSFCSHIAGEGIEEIFKSCNKLVHLEIQFNRETKIFGTHSDLSELNLEVLEAPATKIDEDGMSVIAKRCRKLKYLNLSYCPEVTTKGVKEVVENCRNLKEINLVGCDKVSDDILAWMNCSRPYLKKTLAPCDSDEHQIIF